jgi:hypothetical protein
MRTCFAITFLTGLVACVGQEEQPATSVVVDGIHAASRSSDCNGASCITTTLTDAVTGAQLATVTWNGDTAIGSVIDGDRTTQIVLDGYEAMTVVEANEAAHHAWLAMTGKTTTKPLTEMPPELVPDMGTASGPSVSCTQYTFTNLSCTCIVTTCFGCISTSTGESCHMNVSKRCYQNGTAYGAVCGTQV